MDIVLQLAPDGNTRISHKEVSGLPRASQYFFSSAPNSQARLTRVTQTWSLLLTHSTNAVKSFAIKISLISGTFRVSLTTEHNPEQFSSNQSNLNRDSEVTLSRGKYSRGKYAPRPWCIV